MFMRISILFVFFILSFVGVAQTPTMNCPSDIIVSNDPGSCGAVVNYTAPTCATNCTGAVITQTDTTGLSSGSFFPLDTTVLIYEIRSGTLASTCSFMVIVQDTEVPTFVPACPGNITVNNDAGICGAVVQYNRPKGVDNCSAPPTNQIDGTGLSSTMTYPVGVTPQIYQCIDTAGNVATCSFNITVVDAEGPVISSYDTVQVFYTDPGSCSATVNYTMPIASDNCNGAILFTQIDNSGLTNGDVFPGGVTVQKYEAVDSQGNIGDTAIMYIHVKDSILPTVTCPGNQTEYVDANCQVMLGDYTSLGSATDNCNVVSIAQYPVPSTIFVGAGTVVNTSIRATDSSGNFSACYFDIILLDTIKPSITCIADQNVSASGNCSAILQNYTGSVSVTDNCDSNPSITQSPAPGTSITTSQLVTMYATDASGNIDSCTFNVVVDDPIAPTVLCPNDSTVYDDANCGYTVPDFTSLVVATDNCDPNPSIVQTPAVNTVISGGTTQFVSFAVSDVSGNVSYCSFLLTVVDTIGPTYTCVPDQTVYVDQYCDFTLPDYTGMISATDNCGGNVFLSQSPVSGTQFTSASVQNVTISAQDNKGNITNCTFQVFILDTISPTIMTCANDTTINADVNCEYLLDDFTGFVSALDSCSATNTYTQSLTVGTVLPVGSTTPLTLYATDQSGNSSSCSINISVVDGTSPVLNCPANPSVGADNNCQYVIPDYSTVLNIVDNCDPSPTYTQSVSPGTILSGIGSQQTISIFVSDASGNNNSCSFIITVADTTAPTIICPSDTLININSSCQFSLPNLTSTAIVSDFCDPSPTVTQSPGTGVVLSGIVPITLIVHDASGNSSTCQFNAIGNDTVPPTITCPSDFSSCDSVITYNAPVGVDDCSVPVVTQIDISGYTSGDVFPVGQTILTYQATDLIGNSTNCNFIITRYSPVVVNAGNDTLIDEGVTIDLNGFVSNAASYSWTPDYGLSSSSILNPTITPTASVVYYLMATSPDGCTMSDSVKIYVNKISDLEINNFLSPNGDGKNETWNMNKPSLIGGCQVSIFDTWGKVVWSSSAYANDWDGTNQKGEALPEGTYFFIISNCQGYDQEGSIMLMR